MNPKGAGKYILKLMERSLSSDFHYHNVQHTLDVHNACVKFAYMEGVNSHDLILLETAAYYHDCGITEVYENHEEASVKIARGILPQFGYTEPDLDVLECIILKTKLPQSAITLLGEILCDADLNYIGRPDFFMIAHRLRYEWELLGKFFGLKEWYEMQYEFLTRHRFYTRAARITLNEGKERNLEEVRRILGKKSL